MAEPALLADLGDCAAELRAVAEDARALTPEVETSLRAATGIVDAGDGVQPTIAILGEAPAARRALVDALLGAHVLGGPSPGHDVRLTSIRRAPAYEYRAHSRDGRRVVRFSQRRPDGREALDRSVAQAEADLVAAHTEADEQRVRLEAARAQASQSAASAGQSQTEVERVESEVARAREALAVAEQLRQRAEAEAREAPQIPTYLRIAPVWWAVWVWVLRLVLRPFWRNRMQLRQVRESVAVGARGTLEACAADAADAMDRKRAIDERHREQLERLRVRREVASTLEREVAGFSAVEVATSQVERRRNERDRYLEERRAAFVADLRAMGKEIAEVAVEYPAEHLPDGVTLLDIPGAANVDGKPVAASTALAEAHGFVLVVDADHSLRGATSALVVGLAQVAPRLLVVQAKGDRVIEPAATIVSAFARIHAARSVVVGLRAAMRLRSCIDSLSRARASGEEAHRKRLTALVQQPIPDPAEFRARQMERAHATIEKGAEDAVRSASAQLRSSIAQLRLEWMEQVAACTDRAAVRAVLETIDATASVRIGAVLERTTEEVAHELQSVTETIQTWAFEEIQARYRLARRVGSESLSPLASELTREDLELGSRTAPAEGAMDTFEKQRLGYGLGGVAAGAALGTLIFPGIGTAIGAFVGVFAGFLKGVESLQQDCLAKIDACLSEAESHALAQLLARQADMARVLRETVDGALGEAFERLEQAIARLMDVERRAIAAERAKIDALVIARGTLVQVELRLERAIEAAQRQLGIEDAP